MIENIIDTMYLELALFFNVLYFSSGSLIFVVFFIKRFLKRTVFTIYCKVYTQYLNVLNERVEACVIYMYIRINRRLCCVLQSV